MAVNQAVNHLIKVKYQQLEAENPVCRIGDYKQNCCTDIWAEKSSTLLRPSYMVTSSEYDYKKLGSFLP